MGFIQQLIAPALKWYIQKQSKKSLPNYSQSFELRGLHKKVDIIRDRWAVPHIHASTQEDLIFAQGFLHAQDRLWQMEMNRRIAAGRLSELYGLDALEADRTARTLGFFRLGQADAKRYEQTQLGNLLKAYAKGVNSFIEQHSRQLPVEFKLLRIQPEPWEVADSMAYARFISFRMSYGFMHEIERMRLIDTLGAEKAQELFPEYNPDHPTILPEGIQTYQIVQDCLKAFQGPWLRPLGGSNNWSVAANLMESQSACLANDPHLAIGIPNIWYENHLICPELEVTGVSILGAPLVLIGHNRKIAWGATLSFIDVQDCYVENFIGDNCKQYHSDGRIKIATHLEERIKVKGRRDHIQKIIQTHHGPIISDVVDYSNKKISLQSTALQDFEMLQGFYKLNLAENWNDFVNACAHIQTPSLNINYADTSDNVGYYVTGKIPIRETMPLGVPRLGWETNYEWKDYIPFERMPHALNPPKGYLFTCNHKITPDNYPYNLGEVFMNGYRAKRLEELFQKQNTYHVDDFKNWQMDFYSIPGVAFRNLVQQQLVDTKIQLPKTIQATVKAFVEWDGILDEKSVGGAIFQVLKQELIKLIIGKQLGEQQTDYFRGKGSGQPLLLDNEFWGHDSTTLLRILSTPEKTVWLKHSPAQTLIQALEASTHFLKKELGTSVKQWQWGKLHQMKLMHFLGVRSPLDQIFNVERIAIGGDTDTVCQIAFQPGQHYGGTFVAASYRQIIDMGNFSKSYCISAVGQSGNLLSPHRLDQFDLWKKGTFKPMIWTMRQQKEYALYQCSLTPI